MKSKRKRSQTSGIFVRDQLYEIGCLLAMILCFILLAVGMKLFNVPYPVFPPAPTNQICGLQGKLLVCVTPIPSPTADLPR